MEVRRFAIPPGIEPFWLFESDQALKQHSAYLQAKAGDGDAAVRLISDLALAAIYAQRDRFAKGSIFVAPFAREASGDNAIPQVLAEVCAVICGACADQNVVQVTKVYLPALTRWSVWLCVPRLKGMCSQVARMSWLTM